MRRQVAEQRLIAFLTKRLTLPDGRTPEVSIYCFRDNDGGIRISEVGYSIKGGPDDNFISAGASWMRSDCECAGMILACEDFLLFHDDPVEDHGDGMIFDYAQEKWHALEYHINEKWDDVSRWIERPDGATYPEEGV